MTDPSKYPDEEIDRFDDVFHSHGDDIDEDEDANVDFDLFFTNFDKNNDEVKIEVQIGPVIIDENTTIDLTTEEEQHLSQKLSQLSASDEKNNNVDDELKQITTAATTVNKRPSLTPTTPIAIVKKLKTDAADQPTDAQDMPAYLSISNAVFERAINPLLQKTANTANIEDLRNIALIKHKMALTDLNMLLWTTYLRSGTGKLKEQDRQQQATTTTIATHPSLSRWPEQVAKTMIEDRYTALKANEIDYDTHLNFVYKMIRQFREQHTHYQTQLKHKKERVGNIFTLDIEENIDKFVEQHGIAVHRIRMQTKILIVEYDYNDRFIESQFHQENPDKYQLQTFDNLTQGKLDKEVAKLDVAILKERFRHNNLPSTVDSLRIPAPISLNTVNDATTRQRLTYQCEQLLQRTKSDMMLIYIATAEAKMNEHKKKFDTDMAKFKDNQSFFPAHNKLTKTMCDIMERRFKNINERLINLYKLKLRFFVQAPTVKN